MDAHKDVRTFETGSIRDGGKKPALQLISPHAMNRLGEWLRFACEDRKPAPYPKRNWEKGQPFSEIVASLLRHVEKYILGDTSEDHVAAILFGGMALAHYEEEIKAGRLPQSLDDMPHYVSSNRQTRLLELNLRATAGELLSDSENAELQAALDARARIELADGGGTMTVGYPKAPRDISPFARSGPHRKNQPDAPQFVVYLCGPITAQDVDYLWRDAATAFLNAHGIKTLDPLRGKHKDDVGNLGLSYKGQLAAPEIAERDKLDIQEADVILAHFPYMPARQSIGSLMEMGAAAIGLDKPVILCSNEKVFNEHLFCRNFCTLEPNFEQALQRIVAMANARRR